MNTNFQKIIFLAAFCAIFGCVTASAQIKTGGYKSVSVTDAAVIEAAEFAVEAKAAALDTEMSLEEIEKAEVQTVAGTNYRLCLKIYVPAEEEETDGVTMFVKAVIFRNLKKEFSLTSWTEEECAEK